MSGWKGGTSAAGSMTELHGPSQQTVLMTTIGDFVFVVGIAAA